MTPASPVTSVSQRVLYRMWNPRPVTLKSVRNLSVFKSRKNYNESKFIADLTLTIFPSDSTIVPESESWQNFPRLFLLTESPCPECHSNAKPSSPGSAFFQFKVIKATGICRLQRDIHNHYLNPEEHKQALSNLSLRLMIKIDLRIKIRIRITIRDVKRCLPASCAHFYLPKALSLKKSAERNHEDFGMDHQSLGHIKPNCVVSSFSFMIFILFKFPL